MIAARLVGLLASTLTHWTPTCLVTHPRQWLIPIPLGWGAANRYNVESRPVSRDEGSPFSQAVPPPTRFLPAKVRSSGYQRAVKTSQWAKLKSSHFERSEVRRRGSSTFPLLTETFCGERTQDGDCRVDISITVVAMVRAANRSLDRADES